MKFVLHGHGILEALLRELSLTALVEVRVDDVDASRWGAWEERDSVQEAPAR